MPFLMARADDRYQPVAKCDQCGNIAPDYGLALWPVTVDPDLARAEEPILIACSSDCADLLAVTYEDKGEWAATPLDVYLATLVTEMNIDIDKVLEAERASIAAFRTRDESPD